MNNLDLIQSEIELLIDDDKLEADIDEASHYSDRCQAAKMRAEEVLSTLNTHKEDVNTSSLNESVNFRTNNVNSPNNVNLPKLDLPRFNGNPLEFFPFWERFDVAVNSTNIPDVNKFIYLKSVLDGDALAAVRGLAMTPDNYCVAKDIILDRFGRKEKIIFHHVECLLNFKDLRQTKSIKDLWSFRDEINGHIRSLQTLGINGDQYGVFLTPIILNKLPSDIRMEWARNEGKESDSEFLMDFLNDEIKRKERSMMFQESGSKINPNDFNMKKEHKGWYGRKTVSTFVSQNKHACIICDKMHKGKPEECFKLLRLSKQERGRLIKSKSLCFACFGSNHLASECQSKCKLCHGRHHELLCNRNEIVQHNASADIERPSGSPEHALNLNHALFSKKNCNTVLQVIKVNVSDGMNGNKTTVNVLLDGGSDHTYVTSDVVKRIKPNKMGRVDMAFASFGQEKPSPMTSRNIYCLEVEDDNGNKLHLNATEIETICTPIFRPRLPPKALQFVENFPLCEDYAINENIKIDILIGMDNMWAVLKGDLIHIPNTNLVLQKSVFGWVVSGSFQCASGSPGVCITSHQLHSCEQNVPHLQNLWDLDSIGIREEESMRDDELHILAKFEESVTFEGNSYEVKLPWKGESAEKLQNNELIAKGRLTNLMKRMNRKPELLKNYLNVFSQMEDDGIIVEVPKDKVNEGKPIFYLPHHPVVKESSLTTKVRPVFDASCPGVNGVSLNDCLWSGPCLLPDLIGVLLRFRRWPVVLTADVKQAFLNIRVHSEDTDAHRFLLPDHDGFKVMKFVRVPFGNKSSPFLLNATVKHHLNNYQETRTVKELKGNLYVDDWLTGANTNEECLHMVEEATDIMASASLPLTKWACNDKRVSEQLEVMSGRKGFMVISDHVFKVLGIQWNRETDCFVFSNLVLDIQGCPTKRAILSLIARIYDPLGLLTPFIMTIKIMFQDIWKTGLDWDQPLPMSFVERLDRWIAGLVHVKQFKIVRNYFTGQWVPDRIKGLYCFCDASERAYGSCVYIVAHDSDGSFSSTLVYSKAKVAPLKTMSLPRLELLGALLAARMVSFVKTSLYLDDTVPCVCFTDSMVALAWIKGNPIRWKTFVSNRVTEIQKLTEIQNWYHVPGSENPADILSRGVSGETLVKSELWLRGPKWLGQEATYTEHHDDDVIKETMNEEVASSQQFVTHSETSMVFDLSRWSTFNKAVRIVAWVLRFIHNTKKLSKHSLNDKDLSVQELKTAEAKLVQHVQRIAYSQETHHLLSKRPIYRTSSVLNLNPFIGSDGFLRAQRRLEFSELEYDEKFPIVIPKGDLALLLIRHHHISMKHAGVDTMITSIRKRYWIVGLRRQAKKIKSDCIPCRIQDSTPCNQMTAPLPPERVKQAHVFSVCGIDFAGPLYCSDLPKKKLYVLLFTCAVVRAVHVELVESLSVNDFLLGFVRFACRRSLPTRIISDNAKTFISAHQKLKDHYGPRCPVWKFNAPLSPWWGAFWERMVRSIKSNLRKSIGNKLLKRTELESTLCEVESCVNSRPLTFVGDNVDSVQPLTPSHFLTPNGSSGMHDPNSKTSFDKWTLCDMYSLRHRVIEMFWERWSTEYLRNLPTIKTGSRKADPVIGSLVMINDNEHHKRLQWPTGVVTNVIPGRDGLIRTVEINTVRGKVIRPIQRLHVLEAPNDPDHQTHNVDTETNTDTDNIEETPETDTTDTDTQSVPPMSPKQSYITGRGRVVKPKCIIDL